MTTLLTAPPTILIVGGAGHEALRATLEAVTVPSAYAIAVVATAEEARGAIGLARTVRLDPWPGRRAALAHLVEAAAIEPEDLVHVVVAGSRPNLAGIAHARTDPRQAGLVIPASGRQRGVRGLPRAILRPGGGMTLRGDALLDLADAGWFTDRALTAAEVRDVASGISHVSTRIEPIPVRTNAAERGAPLETLSVTLVIPAFNEAAWIGDTIRSVRAQTRQVDEILVIDDGSTDATGAISRQLGARVHRTGGTGSKGAAVNSALRTITTDALILVDADTRLHPEAVRHLMRDLERGEIATHGAVIPSQTRGLWARARLIDYAVALRLTKRVQGVLGKLIVLSGCSLAIRRDTLLAAGGFQDRTMVEDLDLTWTLQIGSVDVAYTPNAVAYPIEPETFAQFRGQMRRWARGFFQSVSTHRRDLRHAPALAFMVAAALWDMLALPLFLILIVTLTIVQDVPPVAWGLVALYQAFWTMFAIAVAATAIGARRALRAAPAYTVLNILAIYFYFEAFITEWVLRRHLRTWTKGH